MKTGMKKVLSLVLALLMLLPILSAFVVVAKEYVDITDAPQNIAYAADITVVDGLTWSGWKPEYLVDGDATTGTFSPRGKSYAIALEFAEAYYFSELVIAINREGTLPNVATPEKFSDTTKKIKITAYNGNELVYESAVIDTTDLEEVSANIWTEADKIVISAPDVSESALGCEALWEIEAWSRTVPGNCDAETKNVASEALVSMVDKKKNNEGDYIYTDASWWAMDIKALTDGDIRTGTKTAKRATFIVQLDYGSERMISSVKVTTNGAGTVANAGNIGVTVNGDVNEYSTVYNSYQLKAYAYDNNDDLIYESDVIDVSSLEDITYNIGASAAIIRLEVSGAGNVGYGGSLNMWEVEVFEETGSHAFEKANTKNPSCVAPGYIEYQCQDPNCDYTKKEVVAATGFHEWDSTYEIVSEPTATANGVALYTCKVCSTTTERDIPALEHNWNEGTVYAPDCTNEGYTLYSCTDSGCNLKYKSDFVAPYGHNFDDGVVTKKQTIDQKGLLVYSCLRDGCDGKTEKVLRKARYTDSTFKVDSSIVTRYDGYQTVDTGRAQNAYAVLGKYVFDGTTNEGKSGTMDSVDYWFSPGSRTEANGVETRNSGLLYIYLDRDYYFTKGMVYAAANYKWFEVHFQYKDAQGNWVTSATYRHDRFNDTTVTGLDMTGSLGGGARASRIVLESVNGGAGATYMSIPTGSPNAGGTLQIHELVLEAHSCNLTESDYEPERNWNKATCDTDGSCKATCPVCNVTQTVTLPAEEYGHTYGAVTPLRAPTCSRDGLGQTTCTKCNKTSQVVMPSTGVHKFEKEITYVEPTCNSKGIKQLVCVDCNAIGMITPLEATGVHIYDWIVKSSANYTAEGTTIHACKFCGEKSGLEDDIITEKLEIPEEFISFDGFGVRTADFVGLRAKFSYDTEIYAELQKTCDITITVHITDANGNTKSIEVVGKRGTNKYDKETGEFSVVVKSQNYLDDYTFSYSVKLSNFRGTVEQDYELENATASIYAVADAILESGETIPSDIKKIYEEIVAEH